MWKAILTYVIVINIIGFYLMKIDKNRAKRGGYRIPEKTLFTIAIIFGSIGITLGMKRFRHKTKHKSFVFGIPAIQLCQVVLLVTVIYFLKR